MGFLWTGRGQESVYDRFRLVDIDCVSDVCSLDDCSCILCMVRVRRRQAMKRERIRITQIVSDCDQ